MILIRKEAIPTLRVFLSEGVLVNKGPELTYNTTHQILIREDFKTSGRLIAGVDIEERRGFKENHSRIDCLFKKTPSKAQRALYAPVVGHIRLLGHHHLDQGTLGRLSAVGIDPEGVKKNIETWEGLKPF